jgi:hypothetical protein
LLWLLSGASSEGTRPWRSLGRPGCCCVVCISVFAVMAAGGFALMYGPSPGLGVPSLRHSSGGIASGRLRSTSSQCVRLCRAALRAHPRMNTSTQPSEGAGGSRSRAAGELTLGLLSGQKRKCGLLCFCFSVGATVRRSDLLAMTACQPIWLSRMSPIPVGAGLLAKTACQPTPPFQIHPLIPVPQAHMVRLRDVHSVAHCLNASVGALHPPRCTRAPADGVNKGEQ